MSEFCSFNIRIIRALNAVCEVNKAYVRVMITAKDGRRAAKTESVGTPRALFFIRPTPCQVFYVYSGTAYS